MGNFRELIVWQKAKDLAVHIYKIAEEDPFNKDFRFRDQIRSAAVSISANIAEGDELDTHRQAIKHFHIAKGSAAELITLLIIAHEVGYLKQEISFTFIQQSENICKMLHKLIQARTAKNP